MKSLCLRDKIDEIIAEMANLDPENQVIPFILPNVVSSLHYAVKYDNRADIAPYIVELFAKFGTCNVVCPQEPNLLPLGFAIASGNIRTGISSLVLDEMLDSALKGTILPIAVTYRNTADEEATRFTLSAYLTSVKEVNLDNDIVKNNADILAKQLHDHLESEDGQRARDLMRTQANPFSKGGWRSIGFRLIMMSPYRFHDYKCAECVRPVLRREGPSFQETVKYVRHRAEQLRLIRELAEEIRAKRRPVILWDQTYELTY